MNKTTLKKPELLSPAGNYEKMKTAFRFGADAVYLSGKRFGMRSAADNFTVEELLNAADFAKSINKKIYLTVNTYPRSSEYAEISDFLSSLSPCPPDAVLVSDLGVMSLVKEILPDTEIHISTQANTVSARTCSEWKKLGADRVVLARELTLEEIREIINNSDPDLKFETFIHGSMCISYSGRCLLSNNLTGRDGNRGACAQPCRWNYKLYEIEEEQRPGQLMPVSENENGTFIMSSRDINMINHIPELINAGIDSFKIEGRMKSNYYVAATAYAYRKAIDSYFEDRDNYKPDESLINILNSVTHREYSTGYFFDNPSENANLVTEGGYIKEKTFISEIIDKKDDIAVCYQKNKISVGDSCLLFSPKRGQLKFTCSSLTDEKTGEEIPSAPTGGMIFSLKPGIPFDIGDLIIKE